MRRGREVSSACGGGVKTLEELTAARGRGRYSLYSDRNFSILKTRLNLQCENSDSRVLGWGTFLGAAHLLTAATRAGARCAVRWCVDHGHN